MAQLNKDEQIANKLMKQHKLGRWATPTNLRVFNKKRYDTDAKIDDLDGLNPDTDMDVLPYTESGDIDDIIDDPAIYKGDRNSSLDDDAFEYDDNDDADVFGGDYSGGFDRDYMDMNEVEDYNDDYD